MGPISYEALVEKHFDAWSKLEGFKYSKEELFDLHGQVKPQISEPKARVSAYQIFKSSMKGIDKAEQPEWSEIKNTPDEFAKYKKMAEDKNKERGFSDEDPKIRKKQKTDERKNALKAAIAAAQKNSKSEEKPEEKSEEKSEEKPEEKPEDKSEEKSEEKSEKQEQSTSVKKSSFDEIDENGDGVITREEFEKFTENSNSDNEDEDESENNDDKPQYTGKAANTALSNFKQWVLQEKELEFNSKVSKPAMDEYRTEFNFDPKKYDDEVPWFEFIKNNMRLE